MSQSTRTPSSREPAAACARPGSSAASSTVDGDGDPLEEAAQALQLRRPDDVEGDEDVGAAGVGHRLGLAQLLARDPDGAERELALRDLGAAVRLHVRAVREPVSVAVLLPAREVALEPVHVDDRGGRVDLVEAHAGSRATASISTSRPGGSPAWTVVRAGYGAVKYSR